MVRTRNQQRKEEYLEAALKLFVCNGVQNTSTAEIAKEAGTAAGTLFLYFRTKDELINELVLKIAREQASAINALLLPSDTAYQAFSKIWHGSVNWFKENLDAYQYIQQVRDSGMIAEEVVQESNKFFEYYYTAIQKGLQEGSIKPYPFELIGGVLYQSVVAVMNLIRSQPDSAQQEEYARQGFEIFWNGIKTGFEGL